VRVAKCWTEKVWLAKVLTLFQKSHRLQERQSSVSEERISTTTTTKPTTPVVAPIKCNRMQKLPPPTQAIVSLTMKDWRDLVDAYNVHADNDTETDEEEVANDNNHDDDEKEVDSRDRSTVAAAGARARGKANARSKRHKKCALYRVNIDVIRNEGRI
jgi:hypothetical protein